MGKRRVGVTARSRQIETNQGTGGLQIVTEMAAPPELRTPMGTAAAKAARRVRMEVWRQWRGSQSAEWNPNQAGRASRARSAMARCARMRRCLILRQGGKPPETPGPLSLVPHLCERRKSVKGSQAAQTPRALDRFPPFASASLDQGKGASEGGEAFCLPLVGLGEERICGHIKTLDIDRPSHGSRERQKLSGNQLRIWRMALSDPWKTA